MKVLDVNVDDGFDKLIAKLDETFKTEKTQELHNVYVEQVFGTEIKNINDYILEFKHLDDKILEFNLKLQDNILCLSCLRVHHSKIIKSRWLSL